MNFLRKCKTSLEIIEGRTMNIFSMAYKLNLKVIAYFSSNLDGNINSCVKRFINLQSCNPPLPDNVCIMFPYRLLQLESSRTCLLLRLR